MGPLAIAVKKERRKNFPQDWSDQETMVHVQVLRWQVRGRWQWETDGSGCVTYRYVTGQNKTLNDENGALCDDGQWSNAVRFENRLWP